jgi:hypothetical protein
MAKCGAGDCEIECGGGRGCGCIAESDNPELCNCYCFGKEINTRGLTFQATTLVDVSINDLPLSEAAAFLSAFRREPVLVPAHRLNERISLDLKTRPFGDVLRELGLTTQHSVDRRKRKIGVLTFLAGLGIGVLISALTSETRRK